MDPNPPEEQENVKKKAPPFQEREITALVKLYCDAREEYNRKFEGASKMGPFLRQMKLKEWAREISSLGVCERSEKQIEERLRADMKRVNKYAADMRKKYTGTGGGEGPKVKDLPHYLMPLYEVTRQKQHVTGSPNIQCEEYDEQPTTSRAVLKVKVEPKSPPRQPLHDVNEPRMVKSPSPLSVEGLEGERESAKPPEKAPKAGEGAATPATSKKSAPRKKSIAQRAKETMSVFTDRRSLLYDEEIRVAKLRGEVLQIDVERARIDLQRSRIELERAELELRRVRLEVDRNQHDFDRARTSYAADSRSRTMEPSEVYRTYTDFTVLNIFF
ncbi:hypothetical protein Y032_0265g676 [Ancylostoma ceylanicum]|nr:hypothetical protein Y032_0265g676 [Ancylostoma ceylanicum]